MQKNNVGAQSSPRNISSSSRRRRARWQRALPLIVLLVGGLGAPVLLAQSGGLGRLRELRHEKTLVEAEIARLTRRIEQHRAEARASREDPRAVEKAARDQLGLVRSTEVVYEFELR